MEKISICLRRGFEESVGNDDVSIVLRPQVRDGQDGVKTENLEGTAQVDFVRFIVQSYLDTLWRLRVISDILWNSSFESYGPKDTR